MSPVEKPQHAQHAEIVETDAGDARVTWVRAKRARLSSPSAMGPEAGSRPGTCGRSPTRCPRTGSPSPSSSSRGGSPGKKVAPAPKTLDVGWRGVWPVLEKPGLPVVAGGRSAGARVACRTAPELGAAGVLALSFPLHPPGRPEKSRADELLAAGVPTLVVQGGNDPFGKPEEFPEGEYELVEVPYGDHGFAVPKRAGITPEETLRVITDAVRSGPRARGLRE